MKQGNRRVVITGFGLVTPLGNREEEVWTSLILGDSAAQEWPALADDGFRFTKACRVPGDWGSSSINRGAAFATKALHAALQGFESVLPKNTGIFIGSTIGESGAFEAIAAGMELDAGEFTIHSFASRIKEQLKVEGPAFSYGTACAAGNYALGSAASAIRAGIIDVAIAGGVEPFSRVAMTGFSRSRAMTSDACKPFDKDRKGMLLGEGAALFLVESEERALAQNRIPLAVVSSLGLSCDAYHPTAPLPDGTGMIRAMRNALSQAKLEASEIDCLFAHGSGTLISDMAEALAIQAVFGNLLPVTALKGALGHSLGAATAIQAAVCVMSLKHNIVPPVVNLSTPDPQFEINLVQSPLKKKLHNILSCGYAFGGLNSALLLQKWE